MAAFDDKRGTLNPKKLSFRRTSEVNEIDIIKIEQESENNRQLLIDMDKDMINKQRDLHNKLIEVNMDVISKDTTLTTDLANEVNKINDSYIEYEKSLHERVQETNKSIKKRAKDTSEMLETLNTIEKKRKQRRTIQNRFENKARNSVPRQESKDNTKNNNNTSNNNTNNNNSINININNNNININISSNETTVIQSKPKPNNVNNASNTNNDNNNNNDSIGALELREETKKVYKIIERKYKDFTKIWQEYENSNEFDAELYTTIGIRTSAMSASIEQVMASKTALIAMIDKYNKGDNERVYIMYQIVYTLLDDPKLLKKKATKYSYAWLLVFIIAKFGNEFMDIFKAICHVKCNFTLPYCPDNITDTELTLQRCQLLKYPTKNNVSQADIKSNKALQFGDKCFVSESLYFERLKAYISLYSTVMLLNDTIDFKIEYHGWRWMAALIQFPKEVYPEICACLSIFLQICGHKMQELYPIQLNKIINYIESHILSTQFTYKLASTSTSRKLIIAQLKNIIKKYHDNNNKFIKEPESNLIEKSIDVSGDNVFTK